MVAHQLMQKLTIDAPEYMQCPIYGNEYISRISSDNIVIISTALASPTGRSTDN
jgi:hypothetical protein